MEFDKSRVYTALNAEELQLGSKVLLSDNLTDLEIQVEENATPTVLILIGRKYNEHLFCSISSRHYKEYTLAYLVSPPAEPEYKPFTDTATAFKTITAHGSWLKGGDTYYLVTGVNLVKEVEIRIRDYWISATYALENFVFADDGTPVGEKFEDTAPEDHMPTNKCARSRLCTALLEAAGARRRTEKCTIYL